MTRHPYILAALSGAALWIGFHLWFGGSSRPKAPRSQSAPVMQEEGTQVIMPAVPPPPPVSVDTAEPAQARGAAAIDTPRHKPVAGTDLDRTFSQLPRTEVARRAAKRDGLHEAPPEVGEMGERFGILLEEMRDGMISHAEAATFFRRCAEDTEVLDGMRALCLHNWRYVTGNAKGVLAMEERIARIADFLPPVRFGR